MESLHQQMLISATIAVVVQIDQHSYFRTIVMPAKLTFFSNPLYYLFLTTSSHNLGSKPGSWQAVVTLSWRYEKGRRKAHAEGKSTFLTLSLSTYHSTCLCSSSLL